MKIEIEVTVDDELRSELVVQLRDLICLLRVYDADITCTLNGANFVAFCDEEVEADEM